MALQKNHELETGISANYWVMSFTLNGISKEVLVRMTLFKDKATRVSGKKSMYVVEFVYDLTGLPSLANPATTLGQAAAICYNKVKQEGFFEGAQDV